MGAGLDPDFAMSGFIATLSAVTSVGAALETLAFGAAGPVALGNVVFEDFEVPASISLPVKQAVAIHKLIGGDRVLDAMGPDYGDIAWSGIMLGPFAEYRAQTIKALVDAAQPVALTWGTWAFTVLAHSCTLRQAYQRIAYSISCVVLIDQTAAQAQPDADLNGSLTADMGSAIATGGSTLSASLETAQTTLQGLAPIMPGSAAVGSALTAVASAQGVVSGIAGSSNSLLTGTGLRAALLGTPIASMADLSTATLVTGALAQAQAATSYLGRMAANLTANL